MQFRLLPAILHIQHTVVARCQSMSRTYGYSFVAPFWRRNDVSICNNREAISTSGFTAMLILTVENMLPIVSLGQMLLS